MRTLKIAADTSMVMDCSTFKVAGKRDYVNITLEGQEPMQFCGGDLNRRTAMSVRSRPSEYTLKFDFFSDGIERYNKIL